MNNKASITTLVLVFGTIFLLLLAGLFRFILLQTKQSQQKVAWKNSLNIAEAGINYYYWHLNYNPGDFEDGDSVGPPYIHNYPSNDPIGKFSLEITPPEQGSTTVVVRSTGWTDKYPLLERTIEVQYAYPSWAEYAYLTHKEVWFGEEENIKGKVHSNGGIRFDATGNSLITSAKYGLGYTCTKAQGCDPSEEKDGIWGEGSPQDLWGYHSEINFWSIDTKLNNLKTETCPEIGSGVYQNPETGNYCLYPSESYGYHLRFNSDMSNTFNVYKVRSVDWMKSIDSEGTRYDYYYIKSEDSDGLTGIYDLPENALIYVQDELWVDGEIGSRVTVIAAQEIEDKSIIINDNLTYITKDGSCALGLIAQKDILIPWYSPDNLEINGVLLALRGSCYRPYYSWLLPQDLRWPWIQNPVRDTIQLYGSVIHYRSYSPYWEFRFLWWTFPRMSLTWGWLDESKEVISGYQHTELEYDPHSVYNPPPYFPTYEEEYEIVKWEEVP